MTGDDRGLWMVGDDRTLALDRSAVMGVVNVTPDSFSDGGRWSPDGTAGADATLIAEVCASWCGAGVAILDVGGESTRPGAATVGVDEERARVLPILEALRDDPRLAAALRSIDTRHAAVASVAMQAGAHIVNDVSGLADPDMAGVVARQRAGLVLGHMRGTPATMMAETSFARLFDDIAADLERSLERALRAGVAREAIVLDPCVGFGKDARQSAALVASSRWLEARLGRPVLIGASRKRFLGEITGRPVNSRELASVAAAMVAVECGAAIVRVHDVGSTLEALRVRAEVLSAREAVGDSTG